MLAYRVGQPGSPESFCWHLGPTEGGQPGLGGEGMGQLGENRVWNLLASLSATHTAGHSMLLGPGRPGLILLNTQGNLRASPLHYLLKVASLACSQTKCIFVSSVDSANAQKVQIIDKEEPGAQKGEVTHARSHSKDIAGPGFKPSSAACKAYRTLMSSSLPLGSL